MPDTDQHPALTFVMVEHHLLKIIRNHRPDVHTLNRVDAAVMVGEGTAEMAASASLFAAPEPAITKIGGAILAAHGADMIASGWHAWNTGNAAQTMTSRAAQAAAMMAHASPVVASITGVAADGLLPAAVLHGATHYAASQAVRVVSADARHLQLNHGDIIDHFHHPVPGRREGGEDAANQNLRSPHRQSTLNLHDHEAPPHNRKAGGHVLAKHVNPTEEYIERRFDKEKRPVVSFFTSKEAAEHAILHALKANSQEIDSWAQKSTVGDTERFISHISGSDAIVISAHDRKKNIGQILEIDITKKEHKGMIYYVKTIRIY
ncbi:RNase A-like domain-containing protein [Gluconobacter cerinus]|uniref:RNase A-like domain-containing protein n=1 Tax=Gluconobacter cerinus TaxID=38307 RepID=UPI00201255D8|nr:RNase A-like domain-containing protein [Gluconobacter cerinus]